MLPSQLTAASFSAYPAEARRLASTHLDLVKRLPLGFLPLLLRELILYDEKFPAERRDIDSQFAYLQSLDSAALAKAMEPFARLRLTPALESLDWVAAPAIFVEQLTAHLWSTHQIDGFRAAATAHIEHTTAAYPDPPLPAHRLTIAIIGQGVHENTYRLFRKLRPKGTYYTNVRVANALPAILDRLARRAEAHLADYAHWHIDATPKPSATPGHVTRVAWTDLASSRAALQSRMQRIYEAAVFDPEAFRTKMAQLQPADIGLDAGAPALTRFQLSLLSEGSGTQVFATTFVQWAAREALRRAQPLTLVARFGPRQRENPMNVLLAEAQGGRAELDPQGSLIDADMGAYYTWLNQQRLSGADRATFLAWFENHGEAVAIGPEFKPATQSDSPTDLATLPL
jgi:hypothetical protein